MLIMIMLIKDKHKYMYRGTALLLLFRLLPVMRCVAFRSLDLLVLLYSDGSFTRLSNAACVETASCISVNQRLP